MATYLPCRLYSGSRRIRTAHYVRDARHIRGYFQIEVIFALVIVAAMLTTLAVTAGQQAKALRQMSEKRAVVRRLENILTALQAGEARADATVQIRRLSTAAPSDTQVWVELSTPWRHETMTLIGIVPAKALAVHDIAPTAVAEGNDGRH